MNCLNLKILPIFIITNRLMSLANLCFLALILILTLQTNSQFCKDPQKGIFMSYNAMSKMDTLPNLFRLIDTKLSKFNGSIVKDTNTYSIINLNPQLYYNQHFQIEKYVDKQTINVTLGKLSLAYQFNYETTKDNVKYKGRASGYVEADGKNFVKKLIVKDGALQWDPIQILDIKVSNNLAIEVSNPKMTLTQKQIYQQILNRQEASHNLKANILADINKYYKSLLKEHLNNQTIANNAKIQYKYKNYTFSYINEVRNYSLYNTEKRKGLQVFFLWELENKTKNCSGDNIYLGDEQFGGLQQTYSISIFAQTLKDAAGLGIFDVALNKAWQVSVFQFYMGDLAGSIEQANKYSAADPFTVDCKWNRGTALKLSRFQINELYAQISLNCLVKHDSKQLLQVQLLPFFVVKIFAEDETLKFRITDAGIYTFNFKSIDPKFIVTNKDLMKFHIQAILDGLVGQITIGTDWKTLRRKFPSVYISQEYITLFDPSQL